MTDRTTTSRENQRHRTRKDLLAAAARLLKQGRTPDMDEVAAEAMVSRATAYRYFPSIDALLVEAPLEGVVPSPEQVFSADDDSTDPIERIDRAEAALHEACYRNEAQLRMMLAASLDRTAKGATRDGIPVRQNRRTLLIEAALAPMRRSLSKPAYARLCAALAMIFGTESMIVFQDVLGVDKKTARKIKSWAVRSLVSAAMKESET
ncbi:MAG: helix-turn-helix transcriptional regulator [Phycisphaeraceae bacterium]|nr:helix-turn-helix transcriptional regulator [Phycisphaeraceae bacterium]MCW5755067.1 helix-turn-helix transcriptional regulator [Phycisphaeraceae bacterium]